MMRQLIVKGARELMIQKTDLLILVLATAGLTVGVYRWHDNTQNISAVTIPASSTVTQPAPKIQMDTATVAVNENPENPVAPISEGIAETVVATQIEETPSIQPAQAQYMEYVVRNGDSLSRIAVRHNTDVPTLQRLNQITGTAIYAGQTLLYPITAN